MDLHYVSKFSFSNTGSKKKEKSIISFFHFPQYQSQIKINPAVVMQGKPKGKALCFHSDFTKVTLSNQESIERIKHC